MPSRVLYGAVILILAVLAGVVVTTSAALPDTMASHFGADGIANGFSTRDRYTTMMVLVVVVLPAVVGLLPAFLGRVASGLLNIPHREYWLAPQRRASTLAFLSLHGAWFAVLLAGFLTYVHWLVVRANLAQPAILPQSGMVPVLAVFLLATMVWVSMLYTRFRRAT